MIQFNLLPDLKLKYIKAERQKRLVLSISTLVTIASLVVLAFLIVTVNVVQQKSLDDLERDITTAAGELKSVEDLDKILTVQSQLNSLSGLHDQKVISSRLFGYLAQVTPAEVSISSVLVDYDANTIEVSGTVKSLSSVNKYADSFKFTTLTVPSEEEEGSKPEPSAAFGSVVLSSFSRQREEAEYTLTMAFDPRLFDGSTQPTLSVPDIFTAGPDVRRPSALFEASSSQKGAQ